MRASELSYDLPEELIAQRPLPERDSSRLLVVERETGRLSHHRFAEIPALLPGPSLLVVNDSRVFPARLVGKRATGGRVELLLIRKMGEEEGGELWVCMGRPGKSLRPGATLDFGPVRGVVEGADREGVRVLLSAAGSVVEQLEECGEVPLPPYIRRSVEPADRDRYQTVYAERRGSVAAPTAGLHFSEEVLRRVEAEGHELARVTLHVGPGTFLPVRVESLADHEMHGERYEVGAEAVSAIERARIDGRPVIAIGTTAVRALESAAAPDGEIMPGEGTAELFITPGYEFRVIDGLLTNFHLPRSTLLALVFALAGREAILAAYREAIRSRYRFYSYGDAMLVR